MSAHKNYTTLNLNLFSIMAVAMVAALSGLAGCDDDREGCGWELDNGQEYYTCRDDDGDIDRRSPAGENTCVLSHTYLDDDGTRIFVCLDGEEFTMEGQDGEDGSDGVNGVNGSDGIDGQGCVLSQVGDTCTITCPNGSTTFWCGSAPPGGTGCVPSIEVCNGRDDDCDGQIDEGGVCGGTCQPTAEVCDGVDNDCDGQIDEGLNCGGTTTGSWQVLAMQVNPSDQTLTCDGTPIVPSTNCNGTVGFNRNWIENRTTQVYNGTFTQLSLLGGNGYTEAFNGLLGGYCAVRNSATLGSQVNVGGAPVGASIRIASGSAYSENGNTVTFGFEAGDSGPAVVCWLAIDQTSFQAY